jgi:hypothetical protein
MRRVGRGDRHVARARLPGFLSDPDLHIAGLALGEDNRDGGRAVLGSLIRVGRQ